ncbi:uncharacterized protein [Glycine max]|uniref:uncharacterized protein n=1 Tax=Glycine max TaxID=3847 RepID=UPI0003DEBF25|nr:uncharacterized protein LOC100783452 [Glycine max]|eukprot:XP_006590126.1 uncharacterized protein LOC100783452 [Glycine max]
MNIVSYNVRGLGRGVKGAAIRRMVRKHKVDMICIQKSKRELIDKATCQALWGNADIGWEFQPSINTDGGLVQQKRILWDALKQIKQQDPDCIWCFMGDFNNIRHHSEREGISPRGAEASIINDFNEWIAELELQELPSVGEEIHMVQTKWGFKESARQAKTIDWGPKPFKGGFALKVKIKKLKEAIKLWNREHFGDTLKKVQLIEAELNRLEDANITTQLTQHELMKRKTLQAELWAATQAHESLMRQKARVRWIREGDCNSRYFHLLMNYRRTTNAVKGVLINGTWTDDPKSVKEEVRRFFSSRFTELEQCIPVLDGVRFEGITQHQNQLLVGKFNEEEIRAAGKQCFIYHSDSKTERPTKFKPIQTHIAYWMCIQDRGKAPSKQTMANIIDERQSAFISGRHMLHTVLIANEAVEEAKRNHKPCMVFKVDIERAYDSVSWAFLSYMMRRMGFCSKWIRWIEGCLTSAMISVLVNGSPTNEFIPHRGLRQGDSLAPLLFNIAAEGLTGLMREALDKNLFSSFLVGKNNIPVNILQYADDTIFFGEATWQNVKIIKSILRSFELVSGLKINFAKSSVGAIGKNEQWQMEAARYLNCGVLSFPFEYLGIPIGDNPRSSTLWDPIGTFKSNIQIGSNSEAISMGRRCGTKKDCLG